MIHPHALAKGWEKTIRDFEVPNVEFITNGSLHKVKHPGDYDLIIVDEAHKFRSDESEMFNQLQKLCKTPRTKKGNDKTDQKSVIFNEIMPPVCKIGHETPRGSDFDEETKILSQKKELGEMCR